MRAGVRVIACARVPKDVGMHVCGRAGMKWMCRRRVGVQMLRHAQMRMDSGVLEGAGGWVRRSVRANAWFRGHRKMQVRGVCGFCVPWVCSVPLGSLCFLGSRCFLGCPWSLGSPLSLVFVHLCSLCSLSCMGGPVWLKALHDHLSLALAAGNLRFSPFLSLASLPLRLALLSTGGGCHRGTCVLLMGAASEARCF
jgi:hypothetical protein